MISPLQDGYLLIKGNSSFILIGKVQSPFTLFIETFEREVSQYLITGEMVAVSAPEGGDINQAKILLELVRTYHAPLVVLPRGHPGSRRLTMVVSAGDSIEINCGIQRGTHPEQHLLCGSDEMAGLKLRSCDEGVQIENIPDGIDVESFSK